MSSQPGLRMPPVSPLFTGHAHLRHGMTNVIMFLRTPGSLGHGSPLRERIEQLVINMKQNGNSEEKAGGHTAEWKSNGKFPAEVSTCGDQRAAFRPALFRA